MAHDDELTSATVLAAHATLDPPGTAPWSPGSRRYDVTLDVDRGPEPPERVRLTGVELGEIVPLMGSTVWVHRRADGDWEVRWRGDPNLDVEAHRRELAALAR